MAEPRFLPLDAMIPTFIFLPTEDDYADKVAYRRSYLITNIHRIYTNDNSVPLYGEKELKFEICLPITWSDSGYNDVIRLRFSTCSKRDHAYHWIIEMLNGVWEPYYPLVEE